MSVECNLTCVYCRNFKAGKRHLCRNTIGVGVDRAGCFEELLVIHACNAFKIQAWISDGAAPVLLKIVITYREEAGQPQFRAVLSDWNFAPKVDEAVFAFVPPPSATGIPFAATVKPVGQGGSGEQP